MICVYVKPALPDGFLLTTNPYLPENDRKGRTGSDISLARDIRKGRRERPVLRNCSSNTLDLSWRRRLPRSVRMDCTDANERQYRWIEPSVTCTISLFSDTMRTFDPLSPASANLSPASGASIKYSTFINPRPGSSYISSTVTRWADPIT